MKRVFPHLLGLVSLAVLVLLSLSLNQWMLLRHSMLYDRVRGSHSASTSHSGSNRSSGSSSDWFDQERFQRTDFSQRCLITEHVCIKDNHFGVLRSRDSSKRTRTFEIILEGITNSKLKDPRLLPEPLISREWRSPSEIPRSCRDFTEPANHLVLHSPHVHMLGHFYHDLLKAFYVFVRQYSELDWRGHYRLKGAEPANWTADDSDDSFNLLSKEISESELSNSQFYIFQKPKSQILESQRLYSALFSRWPLQSFTELLNTSPSGQCRCFRRLFLCGFKVRASPTSNQSEHFILEPTRPTGTASDEYIWSDLRRTFRQWWIQSHDSLSQQLRQLKERIIREHTQLRRVDASEFRFVALTRRNVRRKWANLDGMLAECNRVYNPDRVVCFDICLEHGWMHRDRHALFHLVPDILLGIHGAQLTHGVWQKPHSFVVELLPFVPEGILFGQWARTIDRVTPLGVIFQFTDVNHLGFRLKYDSIPPRQRCAISDRSCWKKESHRWDNRDFVTEWRHLRNVLDVILVGDRSTNSRPFCEPQSGFFEREWLVREQRGLPAWVTDQQLSVYNVRCPQHRSPFVLGHHI